jgi:hypothetical protein
MFTALSWVGLGKAGLRSVRFEETDKVDGLGFGFIWVSVLLDWAGFLVGWCLMRVKSFLGFGLLGPVIIFVG